MIRNLVRDVRHFLTLPVYRKITLRKAKGLISWRTLKRCL